jgi:tungstate transport system substrate-binding protein
MRLATSIVLLAIVLLGPIPTSAQFTTVRLAVVPSPEETGLLRELLPDFERESGYRVTVYSGEDLFEVARGGAADLLIAHYGHSGTEAFMTQGLGLWPRALFGNQIAVVGPTADPARIRGLADAGEGFRRIATTGFRSRFVSNNSSIMKYLETVLWEAAGRPPKGIWYVDERSAEAEGLALAARVRAYYIFALPPFLRWQQQCVADAGRGAIACDMEALLLAGPMPHRIMVSLVANPQRFPAVNLTGATALQQYLLRPAVQARIQRFRDPRSQHQLWWAAGLHNSGAALGLGR